jgi:ferredoxin-NADP reductase
VRRVEHPRTGAVILSVGTSERVRHIPGPHYVICLAAPDGYQTSRAYSVASSLLEHELEFFIERLPDGEVSAYLAEQVEIGFVLEVREPIDRWFTWSGDPAKQQRSS